MNANRKNRLVLLFVLLCMLLTIPVYANSGDMSSLAITFENMPDAVFYGTLLAEELPREVADGFFCWEYS